MNEEQNTEKMDGINVLSLFDGMSCGRIALGRAGIKVNKYYASEIDKHAIKVTQHNFPDTIQLGSVVDLNVEDLDPIDLLIGGSPCQSFSFAGKRNGMTTTCNEEIYTLERYLELKQEGFEFEGESYLFWEYMRILTDIRKYNPDVLFLLENVEMGAKWERVLSEAIGIYGVHINSALVSAQNRKRIYWTNIRVRKEGLFGELHSDIPQPEDRGILLKDILEDEVDEKYYLSDKMLQGFIIHNQIHKERGNGFEFKPKSEGDKSNCLNARYYKMGVDDTYIVASRGQNPENPKSRESGLPTEQMLEPRYDGKTNYLTSVQKDNLVMQLKQINDRVDDVSFNDEGIRPFRNDAKKSGIQELGTIGMESTKSSCVTSAHSPKVLIGCLNERQTSGKSNSITSAQIPEATSKGYAEIKPGECFDADNINSKTRCGRKMTDKSNCLMAKNADFMRYEGVDFRKNYAVIGGGYEQDNRAHYEDGKSGTLDLKSEKRQKVLLNDARIRRLTPIECERLQTVSSNSCTINIELCLDQAKNYVNVVEKSPRLLKLVSSVEKIESSEFVKNAVMSILQKSQQIKYIAQANADTPTRKQINKCTEDSQKEFNIIAENAENTAMSQNRKLEGGSVPLSAFINITEGKITHIGKEELHQKDNRYIRLMSGENVLNLYGKEIMQLVEDADVETKNRKDMSSIYTILYRLDTRSIEQMLTILYLFAKSAISGFTQNEINQEILSVQFNLISGYTACVSDTQRYKILGNGWTVDVIAHIFSFMALQKPKCEG